MDISYSEFYSDIDSDSEFSDSDSDSEFNDIDVDSQDYQFHTILDMYTFELELVNYHAILDMYTYTVPNPQLVKKASLSLRQRILKKFKKTKSMTNLLIWFW